MKVWDTFLFNDELDMLECRLTELDSPLIYRHVLVESPKDHKGRDKPLHYAENKGRFSAWNDKIIHVIVDIPFDTADPWHGQYYSRNKIFDVLCDEEAWWSDIILLSDADEIPKLSAIFQAAQLSEPHAFEQRLSMFALEWVYPHTWQGTVASPFRCVHGVQESLRNRRNELPRLPDGGWHLSWLGGVEGQITKVDWWDHTEHGSEEFKDNLRSGVCYRTGWHPDGLLNLVEFDTVDWPRYVAERRCPESWFRNA